MSYVFFHQGNLLAGRYAPSGWYIDMPVGKIRLNQVDSAIASALMRKQIRTIKIKNQTYPII